MNLLLSLLSILILTTSCLSGDYNDITPEIVFTEESPREQTIYADETDTAKPISFKTNYIWRVDVYEVTTRNVENNTDWLRLNQYGGGRGDFDLNITTDCNDTGKDRKAEIVVTCGDKTKFTVVQKGSKRE